MKSFGMWLNEISDKAMQYIRQFVPSWPEYVVADLLYKGYAKNLGELKIFLDEFSKSYGYNDADKMEWKLENVKISKEIFDEDTLRKMKMRGMGRFNPLAIPNDKERHVGAKERISADPKIRVQGYSGPSSGEPVILVRWRDGKYELLEVWHRTIQMILANPNGYNQSAYVLQAMK